MTVIATTVLSQYMTYNKDIVATCYSDNIGFEIKFVVILIATIFCSSKTYCDDIAVAIGFSKVSIVEIELGQN